MLFGLIFFGLIVLSGIPAQAATFTSTGNPDDTASGEVITAFATSEILNYTDINGNPKPSVSPALNISITVLPIYGFSAAAIPDLSILTGQTQTNYGGLTNEGNSSDIYSITFSCNFVTAGPGTWTVNIRRSSDDSLIGTLTPGSSSTTELRTISEDGDYSFYHQVTAPIGGSASAYIVITTSATTSSTPVGQYSGANGLSYGGSASFSDTAAYTISTPLLTLTRVSTVDAPKVSSGYTGSGHDAVPGSIITYKLTYSNTGNSSADSVAVIDKVPAHTNLAHFNQTGSTTNVTLTTPQESATGWTVWYSTETSPQTNYNDSTGWTLVGTLDATTTAFPSSNTYVSGNAQWSAGWVKWEKKYIDPADDDQTLIWGVTVR